MDQEQFLPHPTRSQLLVGNYGSIITLDRPIPNKRELRAGKDGYVSISLSSRGPSPEMVHRLVAQTFLPNPHKHREVNHINRQRADNRANNLEWISHADNIRKARQARGDWVEGKGVKKQILATPVNGGIPIVWPSASAWAASTGNRNRAANVSHSLRSGKPSCGFFWSLVNPKASNTPVVEVEAITTIVTPNIVET